MSVFKRLLKRLALGAIALVAVLALVVLGGREYLFRVGSSERDEVTRKLDADEPGWQFKELQAARTRRVIPPDQDGSAVVYRMFDLGDAPWRAASVRIDWNEYGTRSNRTPPFQVLVPLAAARGPTAAARHLGRTVLARRTDGRYPLTMGAIPYNILLPHIEKVRGCAGLMEYDATLAALDGDPARGLVAARAALNSGRTVGDEPFLVSQLSRMACASVGSRAAEKVVACNRTSGLPGVTDADLAELQAAFAAEADTPWLEYGLRGERAMAHDFFDGIESGRITPQDLSKLVDHPNKSVFHSGVFHLYRGLVPGDHAACLRLLTAYLDAAKLPPHERRAALKAVKVPAGPPENYGVVLTRLIAPACEKVGDASLRVRGELLGASVALACERYRLAFGRWPAALAEIPPTILPVVPTDPFTGGPIRYEHLPDGVAVFSVGPDGLDPATPVPQNRTGPFHGRGVGWRLWNPEVRGLPPEYRPPAAMSEAPTDP